MPTHDEDYDEDPDEDTVQPDLIGTRYRVERAIGQGGMGTVWLCQDEVLRRQVAIKQVGLLPGETATDSARAFREARSSAALSHRNVVTIFDVVEEQGRIWLVMEYVAGRSLSEMIKQDGALEPATVADIGAQVAAGLAAAHAAGTTHRDVKPGNVLVSPDGLAKVSDFGIARTTGDSTLTQSGMVTGTPHYFSPELARGSAPGFGDDVWALGATLYAAVEGHPPFPPATNPVGVLHQIATQAPPRAERAAFLAPVLERMMAPDTASRWSMDDAAHVLGRLADEHRPENTLRSTRTDGTALPPADDELTREPEPVPAPAHDPEPALDPEPSSTKAPEAPPPAPVAGGSRRRSRVPVLLGLLVALIVIGGVLLAVRQLSHHGSSSPPASSAAGQKGGTKGANRGDGGAGQGSSNQDSTDSSGSPPAEMQQFVRDYYAAAPGGTDEAWAMLGPRMQAQGRSRYDGFWRTIRSVDVQAARATPGSNSVQVTLVYHSTDGATSTEHKVEGLVDSDGSYLIDSDEPAG